MALKSYFPSEYLGEGYNERSGPGRILTAQGVRTWVSAPDTIPQHGVLVFATWTLRCDSQQSWGTFSRHSEPEQAGKKGWKLKGSQEDWAKEPISCLRGQFRGNLRAPGSPSKDKDQWSQRTSHPWLYCNPVFTSRLC